MRSFAPGQGLPVCRSNSVFDLVQILYWLGLSTWFGGVLFIAIAAPIVVRAVRESNPVMTSVLSVNLEGQHGTLLAGSIIGQIMAVLVRVEVACAAMLAVALIGHWVMLPRTGNQLVMQIVRTALFLAAVALLLYQWRIVWPRMWKHRQQYIDHADEPDIANPALDEFERYQNELANVLIMLLAVLLGMILFGAVIGGLPVEITLPVSS
jgi:hypothetical protein